MDGAWSDDEVFKALLMAVLSTNTDWSKVERVQGELADLFCGFSLESYAERQSRRNRVRRVVPWFLERRAGSVSLERNLVDFIGAARKLAEHRRAHGSAESYFTSLVRRSGGDPKQAALHLGRQGEYKLPAFGVALAAEALKNLGFDVAKPDRHLGRAIGSFGMVRFERWSGRSGRTSPPLTSRASQLAVMTAVQQLATEAGRLVVVVDNAIWMLCGQKRALPDQSGACGDGWRQADGRRPGRDHRCPDRFVGGAGRPRGSSGKRSTFWSRVSTRNDCPSASSFRES